MPARPAVRAERANREAHFKPQQGYFKGVFMTRKLLDNSHTHNSHRLSARWIDPHSYAST